MRAKQAPRLCRKTEPSMSSQPNPNAEKSHACHSKESVGCSGLFVNKRGLKNALGISSTRVIDQWVRKRMISFIRAGHRTLLFSVEQVRKDLARFEVKAVGRNRE